MKKHCKTLMNTQTEMVQCIVDLKEPLKMTVIDEVCEKGEAARIKRRDACKRKQRAGRGSAQQAARGRGNRGARVPREQESGDSDDSVEQAAGGNMDQDEDDEGEKHHSLSSRLPREIVLDSDCL